MTNLPRLYVNGKFSRRVNPISVSITENITPLSTASITLPKGEELPARSYVELFTPYGSAGMYRVRSPHNTYGDNYSTAELEHMIAEVGDYCVKAEYSEMIAANTAVSRVFSFYKGGKWRLGNYSAIGSGRIALEAKYESVLTVLLSILEQKPDCMMTFNFSSTPWTLNIVKKGERVVSEGRISRNVTSATVTYDDSELCTRLWYQTFTKDSNGQVKSTWVSKDANVQTYGIVEGKIQTSADMTTEEINTTVNAYLNKHKQPRTCVTIQAVDLSEITGERVDKYVMGDLFRLVIPDYSLRVELNITSIMWGDVYGNPHNVTIQLGDEEDTVVTFLHNLDATGSGTTGGSGGGGGKGKQEEAWSEYKSDFEVQKDRIFGYVQHVDEHNKILNQAGLFLNDKGMLIYAQDNSNNIMSKLNVQADRISLVVEGEGKNKKVKRAAIVAAINNGKSSARIEADEIVLDGVTLLSKFNALDGTVTKLVTGRVHASKLWANTFEGMSLSVSTTNTESMYIDRHRLTLGSITISGTTYNVVKWT